MSSDPVVVTPPTQVQPRLNILDLTTNPKYEQQKDLFLIALTLLKERPAEDFRSFYQIAGIHGLPFTAYDGVDGPNPTQLANTNYLPATQWGGYCFHGSQLFPTWHRGYLLLLEQELISIAREVAQQYTVPFTRDDYVAAAEQLRWPFWNWLDAQTTSGVPSIILAPTVSVYAPNFGEDSRLKTKSKALNDAIEGFPTIMPNPLHTFEFPVDTMWGGALPPKNGRIPPPEIANYAVTLDTTNPSPVAPLAPYAYPPALLADTTLRHPNRDYETDNVSLEKSVLFATVTDLIPTWWRAIHDPEGKINYFRFATTASGGASLEGVHNHVHLAVGGNQGSFESEGPSPSGHMALNEVAGFDPIFFLHHANVDRLLSWYQPETEAGIETWSSPQEYTTDGSTPLYPFRKSAAPEEAFWTSDDLRDTTKLGYVYPEFESADPKKRWEEELQRFKPDRYEGTRWYLELDEIEKWQLNGVSFNIYVYVYKPGEPVPLINVLTSPATAPPDVQAHYAGAASVFTSAAGTKCSNCKRAATAYVNDEVDLSRVLLYLDMIKESEPYGQLPADFLEAGKYLVLVAVNINGQHTSGSDIKATLKLKSEVNAANQ